MLSPVATLAPLLETRTAAITALALPTPIVPAAALARAAIAGKLPPVSRRSRTCRTARSSACLSRSSSGTTEGSPIAPIGGATSWAVTPIFATRTLPSLIVSGRGRFFLRPLRAEAEALELAQIEFVEIRRRILLGSVVVHVVRKKRVVTRELTECLLRGRKSSGVSAVAEQWQAVSRRGLALSRWEHSVNPLGGTGKHEFLLSGNGSGKIQGST